MARPFLTRRAVRACVHLRIHEMYKWRPTLLFFPDPFVELRVTGSINYTVRVRYSAYTIYNEMYTCTHARDNIILYTRCVCAWVYYTCVDMYIYIYILDNACWPCVCASTLVFARRRTRVETDSHDSRPTPHGRTDGHPRQCANRIVFSPDSNRLLNVGCY